MLEGDRMGLGVQRSRLLHLPSFHQKYQLGLMGEGDRF
jgi:hypothetical protein